MKEYKRIDLSDVKYCRLAFSVIESPLVDKYVDFTPTPEELWWLYRHADHFLVGFPVLKGSKDYSKYLSMAKEFCETNKFTFEDISSVLLMNDKTEKIVNRWFV